MTRDDSTSDSNGDRSETGLSRRRFVAAASAVGIGSFLGAGTAGATPYGGSRHAIPGRIEAEDYDTDSAGTAYNDTTAGNSGGAYRSGDVDIEATSGGGYNVGWTQGGEWLNYSSTVDTTGTYEVTARVASAGGGGSFTIQQDQVDVGTVSVPDTGGWQSWTTVTRAVDLDAGDHLIAVAFDTGGINLDWLDFALVDGSSGGGSTQSPYAVHSFPGRVQAEDYDTGGEGVAYHDTTGGNTGGAYRSDDVDIETGGSGHNVGWIASGEWLEYTVDVAAGTYDLNARVASNAGGGSFRVEVNGTNVTGTVSAPGTGGWQTWTTTTATEVSVSGGTQTVRVSVESGGFNLDWIELVESGSGGGGSSTQEDDVFAPYLGTWGDILGDTRSASTDRVVLSFIGDGSADGTVNPGWLTATGDRPLSDHAGKVQTLQDEGYDVWVAMGGWDGRVLERDASTVAEVKSAYETVLDTLGVTHLDIDDENYDEAGRDGTYYQMRNEALAQIQSERPDVTVSYTVAARPTGIVNASHCPGKDMISDAIDRGVDLEYVNIMTMDWTDVDTTPARVKSACRGTVEWLANVYPNKTTAERWEQLGFLPNVNEPEWTVSDSREVQAFAEQQDVGNLSMWALHRDTSTYGHSSALYPFEDDED